MLGKFTSNEHEKIDYADDYDDLARQTESHAAEIIFGLVYEYIETGQILLDIGIGTGLSSNLITKAGLNKRRIKYSKGNYYGNSITIS